VILSLMPTNLLGEHIASGNFRDVFVYKPDPRFVIKVAAGGHEQQNINEYLMCQWLTQHGMGSWIVPCQLLNSQYIIMERCPLPTVSPITGSWDLPECFNDRCGDYSKKKSNWGIFSDQSIRMIDYQRPGEAFLIDANDPESGPNFGRLNDWIESICCPPTNKFCL
jgi:hypothetical protein